MIPLPAIQTQSFFQHDANIGIIGRGINIETCFSNIARTLFSMMVDVENIHQTQVITFEFESDDPSKALKQWLSLLLQKAREHDLVFSEFRLKREGSHWKATVAGEHRRNEVVRGERVKRVMSTMLSVKKIDYLWEARCLVEV